MTITPEPSVKFLMPLAMLCLSLNAFAVDPREEATQYLNSLPQKEQTQINNKIKELNQAKLGLVKIAEGEGSPLLMVHGIDLEVFPTEWIKPMSEVMQNNKLTYLLKWSDRKSLASSRDLLIKSIKQILAQHPDEKLTILGFSAGGAISLMALDQLIDSDLYKRIYLHTVASPFYGFEAPKMGALFVSPFLGTGRMEMGIGAYKNLKHGNMEQCQHWITTNCELDKNSCDQKTLNPQKGKFDGSTTLPCTGAAPQFFDDENHLSSVYRAFKQIVE